MNILFKNFGDQIVYSRCVSLTGGYHKLVPGLSGAVANGLTAQISKDGSEFAYCTYPIREVGSGMYKLVLSQSETNCDSAVVHMTCSTTGWFLFDPVAFQTTSTTPLVGITASSIADISYEVSNEVKGLTYDGGISQSKLNEMLLAFLFGAVGVTSSNGINTYTFKGSTGATSFTSFARSTDGIRPSRGTTG